MIFHFFKIIYTCWVAIVFISLMFILSPLIAIPLFFGRKGLQTAYFGIGLWAKISALLAGIRFKVRGRENIQKGKPIIFAINHTSYLDAPAIPIGIPIAVKAIGKKELLKVPVFGWLVKGFAVWVDRKDPESRRKSLKKIRKVLKSGTPILIAPEGTRNNTQEVLLPFKDGAFRLALECQTPITPMIILDAGKLMPRGTFLLKPGKIFDRNLPFNSNTRAHHFNGLQAIGEGIYAE
jgi:1-acyl-sn-glycerol-3-phosphate acyltransferase